MIMTPEHLQSAEAEVKAIQDQINDLDNRISMLTIQRDTEKSKLKVVLKGIEKLKARVKA